MLFHRMDIYFHFFFYLLCKKRPRICPQARNTHLLCRTVTTHRILCLLRAHKRRTPVHPRACFWKECVQELPNKHDWNNQCFSIPRILYLKHRNRDVLEARPVQPASPGLCLFHSSRYLQEIHRGKLCWKGRALWLLICKDACTLSLLSPTFRRTSIKRGGGWMSCLQTPVQAIPSVSCNSWEIR